MIKHDEALLRAFDEHRRSPSGVARLTRMLRMLDPLDGCRVLDVGCGSGAYTRILAGLVGPTGAVAAIDQSDAAIRLAQRSGPDPAPSSVTFRQADAHELPFPDASFDAAICISVLEFCDEPRRVLAELGRVLRPDGRLLVANSDEDSRLWSGHQLELSRRVCRVVADRGRDPWMGRHLRPMLEQAGLTIEREVVSTDVERSFEPGSGGYALARAFGPYLLNEGGIEPADYACWLADLEAASRDGLYCYSVTGYAYATGLSSTERTSMPPFRSDDKEVRAREE